MEESYVRTWQKEQRLFHELNLCFCGYSICQPGHSFGPAVRPNYIVHYILDGQGEYQLGGCTYTLKKGQGFLIAPNVMTTYRADRENPWVYLWVGFEGGRAAGMLNEIGLNDRMPIFTANCGAALLDIVKALLECGEEGIDQYLSAQSLLHRFFACLAHDLSRQQAVLHWRQQNYYVRAAEEFIRQHYAENIRVQDIADHVGISRAYLTALFQKIQQVSPSEYLSSFRLTRAREQLTITDLPVGTIASLCGYRDPLVFSKAFKLKAGMTPTQYRRADRAKQHVSLAQLRSKKET